MINSQIILKAFLNVLPSEPGWVVIHSSIIHLNISGDDFKWEFLKIVKNLVELHGGIINASNNINQNGARVEVIFPKL